LNDPAIGIEGKGSKSGKKDGTGRKLHHFRLKRGAERWHKGGREVSSLPVEEGGRKVAKRT
jgi:hypothetical protein